ncbi:hypothetical protein [Halorubrum ezzemoulense]|uniref:hypothetical protein n=1 Tax=Halorubrum ezzemoulense TaxID=337243 RepID=UPI00232E3CE1|nr:hypothetical protein [Halorubrum ezzemoulense]MDB2240948.1 hypothetical protein [Halorubrum ezzemoulense]
MSTTTPARLEHSGNDDNRIDDESTAATTATARHPLEEEIAEHAPYARDDGPTDGGSR